NSCRSVSTAARHTSRHGAGTLPSALTWATSQLVPAVSALSRPVTAATPAQMACRRISSNTSRSSSGTVFNRFDMIFFEWSGLWGCCHMRAGNAISRLRPGAGSPRHAREVRHDQAYRARHAARLAALLLDGPAGRPGAEEIRRKAAGDDRQSRLRAGLPRADEH